MSRWQNAQKIVEFSEASAERSVPNINIVASRETPKRFEGEARKELRELLTYSVTKAWQRQGPKPW